MMQPGWSTGAGDAGDAAKVGWMMIWTWHFFFILMSVSLCVCVREWVTTRCGADSDPNSNTYYCTWLFNIFWRTHTHMHMHMSIVWSSHPPLMLCVWFDFPKFGSRCSGIRNLTAFLMEHELLAANTMFHVIYMRVRLSPIPNQVPRSGMTGKLSLVTLSFKTSTQRK